MAQTIEEWERPKNWAPAFYADDAESIKREVERVKAKSILEFGPGDSTQALIDMGLEKIVTCEHIPKWFAVAKKRFAKHKNVRVLEFTDTIPVAIKGLDSSERFDIAFVDTPRGAASDVRRTPRKIHPQFPECSRINTVMAALELCDVVLLHDATRPLERGTLGRLHATGLYEITFVPNLIGMARIERRVKNQKRPNRPRPEKLGGPTAGAKPKRRGTAVDGRPDRPDAGRPESAGHNASGDQHEPDRRLTVSAASTLPSVVSRKRVRAAKRPRAAGSSGTGGVEA